MKKIALVITLIFVLAVVAGGCDFLKKKPAPTPEPTPVPMPEPTPEPTPEEVAGPVPTFVSIDPVKGVKGRVVEIDELIGSGFVPMETKVYLVAGANTIEATDVGVIDETKLSCNFNLTGAELGEWDLKIVTPNGEVIESGAFRVYVPSTKTPTPKPPTGSPSIGKSSSQSTPHKTPIHKQTGGATMGGGK
ncbi:MAG: hypothetical protein P9M14_14400 [Candidatus Alcyoniella australis]|nr:hypothetical protein [Candidatus Alcyoniella australis]